MDDREKHRRFTDENFAACAAARKRSFWSISIMRGNVDVGTNGFSILALVDNGWSVTPTPQYGSSLHFPLGFGRYLKSQGAPLLYPRPSPFKVLYVTSRRSGTTKIDWPNAPAGTQYDAVKGIFENAINVDNGILISLQNGYPAKYKETSSGTMFPPLHCPHDILGLMWRIKAETPQATPLKLWIKWDIRDKSTRAIMVHLFRQYGGEHSRGRRTLQAPPDAGELKWQIYSEQGQALIGSMVGASVVGMLARNAANIGGRRMVSDISMFRTVSGHSGRGKWCLAFYIKDVDEVPEPAGWASNMPGPVPMTTGPALPPVIPISEPEPVVAGPSRTFASDPIVPDFTETGLDAEWMNENEEWFEWIAAGEGPEFNQLAGPSGPNLDDDDVPADAGSDMDVDEPTDEDEDAEGEWDADEDAPGEVEWDLDGIIWPSVER